MRGLVRAALRRPTELLVLAAYLSVAPLAVAEDATAAAYKKTGNEKMDASDFVGALDDYKKAQELAPDDVTLYYNIGRAHQLLGHNVEAFAALETFGQRASAEMKARGQFDALLAQTRAKVAFLTVQCVEGARVLVAQRVVGSTPLAKLPVDASGAPVRVSIEKEGLREDVRTMPLPGEKETVLECRLLSAATSGTLVVTTEPSGATISIDGKDLGNRTLEVPLRAGPHTVVARLAGYDDLQTQVMIDAGDTKKILPLALTKSAPITSKWWFWTGVGVVVVGGVVITAALLTEKKPDSGSIPPGQLAAPLVRF